MNETRWSMPLHISAALKSAVGLAEIDRITDRAAREFPHLFWPRAHCRDEYATNGRDAVDSGGLLVVAPLRAIGQ
jgi:hypothetical protein